MTLSECSHHGAALLFFEAPNCETSLAKQALSAL